MYLYSIIIAITIFTYSCPYFPDEPSALVSPNTPTHMNPLNTNSDGCPESITLHIGESHTLKLPAIEGTGYLWIPKSSAFVVWNEDEAYEKVKVDTSSALPEPVGAPTRQILTFKGLKAGSAQMIIEYVRPFGTRKPEKICQFKLHVIN